MFEFQEIQAFSGFQQWQYTPPLQACLKSWLTTLAQKCKSTKAQKRKSTKRIKATKFIQNDVFC